jgi:hypothetical protein
MNLFTDAVRDSEIRARVESWADALESGEFLQARGALKKIFSEKAGDTDNLGKDGHCCLGVACEKSRLGHWIQLDDRSHFDFVIDGYEGYTGNSGASLLPPVQEYFALNDALGKYDDVNGRALTDDNDDIDKDHKSFKQIATFIRQQLKLALGSTES